MMARAALNNLANATVGRSAQIPHAARPSLGARCNRYRAALRLGWRDALRHKARTLLSLLLVMLPIAAMVASIGMTTTIPPTRSRALATIPADTQAVITATARPRTGQPFRQSPESGGTWQDDPSQQPASAAELAKILPQQDRLLPYWQSPELIAITGTALQPGEQTKAGIDVKSGNDIDLNAASTATMTEASPEALQRMLPKLVKGSAPQNNTQIVISRTLADNLGASLGSTVTFVAPPFDGWMSLDGRIGEAVADTQRAWTVSGLTDESEAAAWGLEGWMSAILESDGVGVDGHYLVVGPEPVTWAHTRSMNLLQAIVISRHVLTDGYPPASQLYPIQIDAATMLNHMVTVVITMLVGMLLVLFLVTPAFTVSADQSRRVLGLAAASGAAPRDLSRIISSQGLVIGAIGGVLGSALGFALTLAAGPAIGALRGSTPLEILHGFSWGSLPMGIVTAIIIGFAATIAPARHVARMHPVDALKDRPTREEIGYGESANGVDTKLRRNPLRLLCVAVGPILVLAAIVCAALSLTLPLPTLADHNPGAVPAGTEAHMALLVATILLAVIGLALSIRTFARWCGKASSQLNIGARLALRDAAEHHRRFVPAACAVLITMCIASYTLVITGSMVADQRNSTMTMTYGPSGMTIGADVHVSNEFDRAVVSDAIRRLGKETPIRAHYPVYTEDVKRWSKLNDTTEVDSDKLNAEHGYMYAAALLPAGHTCDNPTIQEQPDTSTWVGQDAASALYPNVPIRCVPIDRSHQPTYSNILPSFRGVNLIMDGNAMRLSGFPNADEAAQVLDAGGVVVGDAGTIDAGGMVRVAISPNPAIANESQATHIEKRKAIYVRGAYPLVMSPATAQALGIKQLQYLGEYLDFAGGNSPVTVKKASAYAIENLPLASTSTDGNRLPWGDNMALVPIGLLALLALMATLVSLLLARTQAQRDMATMVAVGAPPRFLRRYGLTQAAVILLAGAPVGVVSGVALGWLHVAWNRRIGVDGHWLETVPIWGLQAALVFGVVATGLLVAWLVTKPPRNLTRRSLD